MSSVSVAPWVQQVPRLIGRLVAGVGWLIGVTIVFVGLAIIVGLFLRIVLSIAL